MTAEQTETARLFELLNSVVDPEIPVLTLRDLGVLRDISVSDGEVRTLITSGRDVINCSGLLILSQYLETGLKQSFTEIS